MRIGSLFSGVGGIELGFEREGFETKWFVEKDLFCQAVLRKHWPVVKIYDDVSKLDFARLEKVDILTGGFPCQDISIAGKGKGIVSGERSSLWKYFAKAIGEIRPKYAVVENVSALTFRGLTNVLADLAKEGYDAEWFDLRASDFGALHKRERIFIIAYPQGGVASDSDFGFCKHADKKICSGGQAIDDGFIAYSISKRCGRRSNEELAQAENDAKIPRRSLSGVLADFDGERLEKQGLCEGLQSKQNFEGQKTRIITNDWGERVQRFRQETFQRKQGFSWCQNVRRIEDFKGRPDIPEPLIRRSNNEFSARVDRTKSLGNAVVPVCAQFIARRIKEVGWVNKSEA